MAIQFILGRAGSGKTRLCVDRITEALRDIDSARPIIFLVPEQASYQAESLILRNVAGGIFSRLQVLSFQRISYLLGSDLGRKFLSPTAQNMVVWKILTDISSDLKIFKPTSTSLGLSAKVAGLVSELNRSGADIPQLSDLADHFSDIGNHLASDRFGDLGLILDSYHKFIDDRFIDSDLELLEISKRIKDVAFIRSAHIFVDGFTDFTICELAVLSQMIKYSSAISFSLCLDYNDIKSDGRLFDTASKTYHQLCDIANEAKVAISEPVVLRDIKRFEPDSNLAFVEANIFSSDSNHAKSDGSIAITACQNSYCEISVVAAQIHHLVKSDYCRYRDIGVITSDTNSYAPYVLQCFNRFSIPYFIDQKKNLIDHPVAKVFCLAMEIVCGDPTVHDFLSYLKISALAFETSRIDLFENYCLAFGVSANGFFNDCQWDVIDDSDVFDQQGINETRQKLCQPLIELKKCLFNGTVNNKLTAGEYTKIIFDFFESLMLTDIVSDWISAADLANDDQSSQYHRQFYDKFIDIFDDLVVIFPDCSYAPKAWYQIILAALTEIKAAFVPPSLDCVSVGSIDRSRHPELKVVFIVGAICGQFPTSLSSQNILPDSDRAIAIEKGISLSVSSKTAIEHCQYLAYIAFTRACEKLYISYPAQNRADSSAVSRSPYVTALLRLFPDLKESFIDDSSDMSLDDISNSVQLCEYLCYSLGRNSDTSPADSQTLLSLMDLLEKDSMTAGVIGTVRRILNYDNKPVLADVLTDHFSGKAIKSSATRLSCFAACPYKYFARYILGLKKRDVFQMQALEMGNFYHDLLDRLLKNLADRKKDFVSIEQEQLIGILNDTIESIKADRFISRFMRQRPHNSFIITSASDTLRRLLLAIREMSSAGNFSPYSSELSFNDLLFDLAGGKKMLLSGKIDRLDIAETDNRKFAIVFDYKKTLRRFDWSKFYHGLDLQLLVYILAAQQITDAELVGAFYMPIETSAKTVDIGDMKREGDKFAYKAAGLFNGEFVSLLDSKVASGNSRYYSFFIKKNGEPYGSYNSRNILKASDFDNVCQMAHGIISDIAGRISDGDITLSPYKLNTETACANCDYRCVCKFDNLINDYNYIKTVSKEQVLELASDK